MHCFGCKADVGNFNGIEVGFLCGCKQVGYCSKLCQVSCIDKHKPACIIARNVKKLKGFNDTFHLPESVINKMKELGQNVTMDEPGVIGFSIYKQKPKNFNGIQIDDNFYQLNIMSALDLLLVSDFDNILEVLLDTNAFDYFVPILKLTYEKKQKQQKLVIGSYSFGLLLKDHKEYKDEEMK